jgi:hypothetical protein
MKVTIVGLAIAVAAASAGVHAQTEQRPVADPRAVRPIPSQAESTDLDMIRVKIERAGYADVSDLSRDSTGVWRGRARKGDEQVDVVVDKGGRIKSEPR